jgi:long-chain acyl-CoA synthetase
MNKSLNLAKLFVLRAAAQPNHPAILDQREGVSATYGELEREIQLLASRMQGMGIQPGMNVGLHCPSGRAYIVFTYATWLCGACVTPLPMELADEEKIQILNFIAIDWVIASSQNVVFATFKSVFLPLDNDCFLVKIQQDREAPSTLSGLNPAFIRFTSGTTGDAKGVILSHQTIFERIQAANSRVNIGPDDRIVWLLSMAYHFAVSIVAYLTFGATIILSKNSFGSTVLQTANLFDATLIYAAPTHYELMSHESDMQLPSTLRLAIVTTASLPPDLASAFWNRFGVALNETYGIIEVGLPAVNTDQPRNKQGSVGRVISSYELKLDEQNENGIGEILLRGPGMLDAYYQPWLLRNQILEQREGWLATGDLGRIDDDGFLYIVGRKKELISVAGMKFFPQDVETVLQHHPAVSEACVFAVKSPRTGEIPISHLVLAAGHERPSDDELRDHCSKRLANFKIPSQFHWVQQLARTASGKLIRKAEKLGLE